jgi:hypothetical protein
LPVTHSARPSSRPYPHTFNHERLGLRYTSGQSDQGRYKKYWAHHLPREMLLALPSRCLSPSRPFLFLSCTHGHSLCSSVLCSSTLAKPRITRSLVKYHACDGRQFSRPLTQLTSKAFVKLSTSTTDDSTVWTKCCPTRFTDSRPTILCPPTPSSRIAMSPILISTPAAWRDYRRRPNTASSSSNSM